MTTATPWHQAKIGDLLIDIQPGFPCGAHNSNGNGIPHLRPMNVSTEGRIDRTVVKYVGLEVVKRPEQRLRRGDILFNNTNSPELVGKTALFTDDDEPAFSNHMTRLRTDPTQVDPAFLALTLHQIWRSGWFAEHCNNHVSQASISRHVLQALEISVPPLDVQRSLGAVVTRVSDTRSAAIEHLSSAKLAINRFRRSLLAAACSGRLTANWRSEHPVDQSSALTPREDAESDLPASWRWVPLRDLADVRGGIQKQPKRAPKHHAYPYLRVANVLRGKLDLSEIHQFELFNDELNTYRLVRGDLLVVEGNGSSNEIGRAALWDGTIENCVHQNHIIRVRPFAVASEYLNLYWNSPIAAAAIADLAVTTAGLYSLSTGKIASVPIALPPSSEQSAIVSIVNRLWSVADNVEGEIADATRALDRSAGGLLQEALAPAWL